MKKIIGILIITLLIGTFIPIVNSSNLITYQKYNNECRCDLDIGSGVGVIKKEILKDPNYEVPIQNINGVPDYFNWKEFGGQDWTTIAKHQSEPQQCGACAVLSSMGMLESVINIKEGSSLINPDLSEQYILSCLPESANVPGEGCENGLDTLFIFELLIATTPEGNYHNGALLEECFTYLADDTIPCEDKCPEWEDMLVPVKDYEEWYHDGSSEDIQLMKSLIMEKGPVVTGMLVTFNSQGNFWDWMWSHHESDDYYPYYDVEGSL